jgi:glutamine---fructose-6-phosphate transaminase (isomerizing)
MMCGIIACRTGEPASGYLLPALRRLEYRGYDSVGIAVRTVDGSVVRLRTIDRIESLERAVFSWTGAELDGAGIGHTRWATHGEVSESNAHPHADCTGRVSLVHNGVIENAEVLRHALTTSGHRFSSSVDSEVVCHLIEDQLHISEDLLDAVQAAVTALEGSWAMAVLDECTGRIVVAAQKSPLVIARNSLGDFATSDIAAVADWVDEFEVLQDGDVVELTGEHGRTPRHRGDRTPVMARCLWSAEETSLNGYSDHMAKEIDEQPAAAQRVLDELAPGVLGGELWHGLGLPTFDRLQVIGCGTSLNAGHVIGNVGRRLGRLPVLLTVASEAIDDMVEPNTLRLAISQSGETADVLSALTVATADAPVLALTNNSQSTLARRADAYLPCYAGAEVGVAATKTFVCQIIAGTALMLSALVATQRVTRSEASSVLDRLRRLPETLATATTVAKCVVPPIAENVSSSVGFLFIARGSAIPYAAEGALKLKELSYRWAEHYPAGELKHGPLALISEGTPVIVIDNGHPKLAANAAEVAARGGHVVSIGSAASTVPVLGDGDAPWGPIESAVPLQILARTMALTLGRDVDKPRNLAKSVTVE